MNRSALDDSLPNASSQFIIKYSERQLPKLRQPETTFRHQEPKRYSSKQECQKIKQVKYYYRPSHSVLQRSKINNRSVGIPSYLKPTEASISAQLAKTRDYSNAQLMQQKKKQQLEKIRSKSLEKQENIQSEMDFNRVPIEYYDERDYGCGADNMRARVVFRGYAPKNTYYFMKTLKPLSLKPKNTLSFVQSSPGSLRSQFQLRFQSKFESGNLSAVARISSTQYYLFMREDTNTHGLRQWFYFQIRNLRATKVKLRIYKFSKHHSLYRYGMKPYVRVRKPSNHYTLTQWKQSGQRIKYEYDKGQRSYYLEFQYNFQEDHEEVQFATLPPYTYSTLKEYLRKIEIDFQEEKLLELEAKDNEKKKLLMAVKTEPGAEDIQVIKQTGKQEQENQWKTQLKIQSIGSSLAGLSIPYIQILTTRKPKNRQRQAIFVLARTHPGETVSNWSLQAFIDRIMTLQQLREYFDFFIIPMVNPDGVFFGNHRTSVIGQDLNRNFNAIDLQTFPQIQTIQWAVKQVRKTHKIKYMLDLHGHSSRKNIFAYGEQCQINSRQYLHSRILPKLLNDAISSFRFDYCIFRDSRQKKNAARNYFTRKYKITCLTFEQSYGLLDHGAIGVQNWRNFGTALADSLLQYALLLQKGRQPAIAKYLEKQMEIDKVNEEKRIIKHKKMLGIQLQEQKKHAQQQLKRIKTNAANSHEQQNIMDKFLAFKEQTRKTEQAQMMANDEKNKNTQNQRKQQSYKDGKNQQRDNISENEQKDEHYHENSSVGSSELSSGDDQLQLLQQQLDGIKKQILKVGCMKDGLKRQKYNIAQNKLQLFNNMKRHDYLGTYRLHDHKSAMIPRIAKFQMKRKEEYIANIKIKDYSKSRDLIEKEREERRIDIQNKFKKMELPSIRR